MNVSSLRNKKDVEAIRSLLVEIGDTCSIVDFEEHVQMKIVRDSMRLWWNGAVLAGFGYVDDYCNLWFEIKITPRLREVEDEIIAWGIRWLQLRNSESDTNDTLDHCCNSENTHRMEILLKNGFEQEDIRSLTFSRSVDQHDETNPFPRGYTWRSVNHHDSIESLVELHKVAFGTENMTLEYRRAMMNAPQYQSDMDLVAVAPDGTLAAFCVCGFTDEENLTGYTDPIGTHPDHQQKGLAKALVSIGLALLAKAGAQKVELGTSSENVPMQKLAASMGFACVSEKIWFSKVVTAV